MNSLIKAVNSAMGAHAPMAHEEAAQAAASRGDFTPAFKAFLAGLGLPTSIKTAQAVLLDARIPGIPSGQHARIARAVHACTAYWFASAGKPEPPLPEWCAPKPARAKAKAGEKARLVADPIGSAIKTLAKASVLTAAQVADIKAALAAHGVTV